MKSRLMWIIVLVALGAIPAVIYHMAHQHDYVSKTVPSTVPVPVTPNNGSPK